MVCGQGRRWLVLYLTQTCRRKSREGPLSMSSAAHTADGTDAAKSRMPFYLAMHFVQNFYVSVAFPVAFLFCCADLEELRCLPWCC